MPSNDLRFLTGLRNGGDIAAAENLEFIDLISTPVKSDFYIDAPAMKVDKLVLEAENNILRKLLSYSDPQTTTTTSTAASGRASATAPSLPIAVDPFPPIPDNLRDLLSNVTVKDEFKKFTRDDLKSVKSFRLEERLRQDSLSAIIGKVSSRFRKSSIDNNLRYLLSNVAIYTYCLNQARFKDKVKDAEGLFSRVLTYAKETQSLINESMAESFFKKNKFDSKDIDLATFKTMAADATIPFTSGQPEAFLENILTKLNKYGALPALVDAYILKGEVDPSNITPDIKSKMVDHLYKMGVKVTAADVNSANYDEYLALAYAQAKKLTGGFNDPLKNVYSDVSVDTFDYKVDYFETIEEQAIERAHIMGAAVLFYTKVLSDDMGLLRVADAIIMAWSKGKLDIPHGETATKLYRYYKLRKDRMTAEERNMFYKIVFNTGSAEVLENSVVNTDFSRLWNSLMQETVKYIQKYEEVSNAEEFVSKVGIYNSIKNLQYNLSVFMTGMIKSLLPEMYAQLQSAIEIIRQPEVVSQLGQGYQRNMWKVVERVCAEVFNTVPNVSALKTIAIKGHSIFSAIAAFDESQFTDEAFRKLITDVEEFIVANGQIDGKPLGEDDEDPEEDADDESTEKNDNWDF